MSIDALPLKSFAVTVHTLGPNPTRVNSTLQRASLFVTACSVCCIAPQAIVTFTAEPSGAEPSMYAKALEPPLSVRIARKAIGLTFFGISRNASRRRRRIVRNTDSPPTGASFNTERLSVTSADARRQARSIRARLRLRSPAAPRTLSAPLAPVPDVVTELPRRAALASVSVRGGWRCSPPFE